MSRRYVALGRQVGDTPERLTEPRPPPRVVNWFAPAMPVSTVTLV